MTSDHIPAPAAHASSPVSPRRSPVRAAAKCLLCFILGASLTVAVAAASLFYASVTAQGLPNGISSDDAAGRAPGTVHFKTGEVYLGLGIRDEMNYWIWIAGENPAPGEPAPIAGAGVSTLSVGWPFLAFTAPPVRFAEVRDFQQFQAAINHAYGLPTTNDLPAFVQPMPHRTLPTRPIPLGLAANLVLYTLLAAAIVFGPGVLRRALRRRAGRCTACGYPLPGGPRCPECGAPAPVRPAAPARRLPSTEVAL